METCIHCDEVALPAIYNEEDSDRSKPFCCEGCLTVYNVLHQKGLESYYEIKNNSAVFKRRSPVEIKGSSYQYLDDADFLKEFSHKNSEGERVVEFYLEGIHCLACLWLIEKLPDFVPGVFSSKLDLDRSVVTVSLKENGTFSSVGRELNQLGYRPHPLKRNQDTSDFKRKEERSALLRIGIAGAAAGNIMLYAVSLYGGATGEYAQLFNALTVAFAIPVLTYSAFPFYKNAWDALRNRTLSIDIPISVSLVIGAVMGIYNLVLGIPDNYFDSLTALVFLLLMSRYFLQRIQEKGLSASDLHYFYQSESVLKKEGEEYKEIHPRSIKADDILKIKAGDFVPADGIVMEGSTYMNNSLLTGESVPVRVNVGDAVFSGTQNMDQDLVMKATKVQEDSRLGRLLKNVENGWAHRSKIVNLTNKVSKYFTLAVFILSALLFVKLYQSHDLKHALEGAITLLIVTCPCALALAVPLTFTRSLSRAGQNGLIIKSDEVIEKLAEIRNVFIDKTGTITYGKLKIVNFQTMQDSSVAIVDIITNLEKRSRHPVAVALRDFVKGEKVQTLQVEDFRETVGKGVSGKMAGHNFEISKNRIYEDGKIIAIFDVEDTIRPDSVRALKNIQANGMTVRMLSGDRKQVVRKISRDAGLSEDNAFFELSPEDKSYLVQSVSDCMMIGDGANDAIALGQANVGVAVMGAMDISLRAADVYLTTPGLVPVEKLLILSRETMKVIHRNLVLSLCYNSVSVVAAFLGYINPLVAAIIMPLSSLTVLLSTLAGTEKLRSLWKSW
jgi:Cu2+-exporting ATPase/Cu+-exporting ATPase